MGYVGPLLLLTSPQIEIIIIENVEKVIIPCTCCTAWRMTNFSHYISCTP